MFLPKWHLLVLLALVKEPWKDLAWCWLADVCWGAGIKLMILNLRMLLIFLLLLLQSSKKWNSWGLLAHSYKASITFPLAGFYMCVCVWWIEGNVISKLSNCFTVFSRTAETLGNIYASLGSYYHKNYMCILWDRKYIVLLSDNKQNRNMSS